MQVRKFWRIESQGGSVYCLPYQTAFCYNWDGGWRLALLVQIDYFSRTESVVDQHERVRRHPQDILSLKVEDSSFFPELNPFFFYKTSSLTIKT